METAEEKEKLLEHFRELLKNDRNRVNVLGITALGLVELSWYEETDLELGELAWLGKAAIDIGTDNISFSTLPGEWKKPFIYVDSEAALQLVNEHLNPYVEDRVAEDLNIPS